ncbi:MAG: PilT/PilU family type 4a pilus ATPase [Candidatus Eisenbacteria sp.]|nr:PilT/PilU family type 4a pilus ATPase [Candidatus Eisenbacteria bacterium]
MKAISSSTCDLASLIELLTDLAARDGSDLYLTAGSPPMLRIQGQVQSVDAPKLKPREIGDLAHEIMGDDRWAQFSERPEMNFALPGDIIPSARFRVNVFRQRGSVGIVLRRIKIEIPDLGSLGLPECLRELVLHKHGLILIVGPTDSGKSTTLAAMVRRRNSTIPGHIITVEDPIEFVHRHDQSIVTQREIGFDTNSYHDALTNAMRQAPDMIVVGEVRDRETMESVITFSDTGHLCLTTLHSTNASQAFERVINFFPTARHSEMLLQLAINLRAVLSQRLLMGKEGKRVLATELLLNTPRIKDMIKKGKIDMLKTAMEESALDGCHTFDMSLYELQSAGEIDLEQALAHADSANNLRLRIKVAEISAPGARSAEAGPELRIREDGPDTAVGWS